MAHVSASVEQRRHLLDVARVEVPALVLEPPRHHVEPAIVRTAARGWQRLQPGHVLLEDLQIVQAAERLLRALERAEERTHRRQPRVRDQLQRVAQLLGGDADQCSCSAA